MILVESQLKELRGDHFARDIDREAVMKELLIEVLAVAFTKLQNRVPTTKTEIKSIEIQGIDPWKLPEFLRKHEVPKECRFTTNDREAAEVAYNIEIPTTANERVTYRRKSFNGIVFPLLYDALFSRGYKRVGFNSGLLEEFKDTTAYDMYIAKDFDRLVKYYSLFFIHDKAIEIGENKRKES